jgi:hypothetical protein
MDTIKERYDKLVSSGLLPQETIDQLNIVIS